MSPFSLCWHRQPSRLAPPRSVTRGLSIGALVALSACTEAHPLGAGPEEQDQPPDTEQEGSSSAPDEEEQDEPDDGTHLTYCEHAKPIIDQKCGPCHSEGGIGPMQFASFDDVKPLLPLIK